MLPNTDCETVRLLLKMTETVDDGLRSWIKIAADVKLPVEHNEIPMLW